MKQGSVRLNIRSSRDRAAEDMSSWIYDNDPEEWVEMRSPAEREGAEERYVIIYEGAENKRLSTGPNSTQNQRDTEPLQTCYSKRSFIVVSLSLSVLLAGITTLGFLSLKLQLENVKFVQKHEELNRERLELGNFCKDGCRSCNQSFYYVSSELKTWEASRQDCRDRGAYLIIIDSKEEQEFVSSLNQYYWIGLSSKEGFWKRVDGSILTNKPEWVNWDYSLGLETKNCILTYLYRSTHYWENYDCKKYSKWICEKNLNVLIN
ncbi:asialoglycoprotein receptor 2-like [Boleophthalmus pectinirostris]|uniref:asialoglycoprotein receptor 2-like n=1 Tax=Boleophthalmus pectinirostris TaxID=150288 RepID=UPI00242DE242|nr:asialoglycoprotein receptor 2-like [Boleophthalmus pectinirostris]